MHYALSFKYPRRFFIAAMALVFALGTTASARAQTTVEDESCDTIQGTIHVADDAPDKQSLAKIIPQQADEAAVGALPGATVQDTDLEEEDDYLVYEVELDLNGEEYEAYVDAGSGDVLCLERDD